MLLGDGTREAEVEVMCFFMLSAFLRSLRALARLCLLPLIAGRTHADVCRHGGATAVGHSFRRFFSFFKAQQGGNWFRPDARSLLARFVLLVQLMSDGCPICTIELLCFTRRRLNVRATVLRTF